MFHQSKNLSMKIIKRENIKNFSAILSLIEAFENEHLSGIFPFLGKDKVSLTEVETKALEDAGLKCPIDLLNYLKNSIHELYANEKTRLENTGKIAEYCKSANPATPISQEDLINDSKQSISDSATYTISTVKNLWEILLKTGNNETYSAIVKTNPTYHSLFKLLKDVMICFKSIIENAEQTIEKVDNYYGHFYEGSLYQLARSLKAKFIPFSQGIDPIRGNAAGNCYGYVMEWKNQIIKHGRYLRFRLDNEANVQQHDQSFAYNLEIKCRSTGTILHTIDDLINQSNETAIYTLSTNYYPNDFPHIVGFRKFSTGEIEFFDSNLGIFTFKEKSLFRMWLNELLTRLFIKNKATILTLQLKKMDMQPANATPSAPLDAVSFDPADKNGIKNNLYKTKYFLKTETLQEMNKKIANIKIDEIDYIMVANSHYEKNHRLEIMKLLDYEINRLKKKTFDFSNERENKIKSLEELKLRFENRSIHDTTKGIVLTWLMDKPNGSDKSYEAIIKTNHTSKEADTLTFQCVCDIMANYEINTSGVEALQIDLLNHLFEIMQHMSQERTLYQQLISKNIAYCSLFSSTSSFTKLKGLCSADINVQEFLRSAIEIYKTDRASSQDKFFAKNQSTEMSNQEDPLAKIFRNINIDNEKSLTHQINSIIEYKSGLKKNVNFLEKILAETNRQIEFKKAFGKN